MDHAMKYFIYISDTKVDMLYSQIPQKLLDKIAVELSIDLKYMGTGVGAAIKPNRPEETRYSKLRLITEYIEKHLPIGLIDTPNSYFKGSLSMHWGMYPREGPPSLVYFGGTTDRTILGLTGSPQHVLGNQSASSATVMENVHISPSLNGYFALESIVREEQDPTSSTKHPLADEDPADLVEYMTTHMSGITQHLEFLTIMQWRGPRTQHLQQEVNEQYILLGSPIYVALL
jgi:hypothetical protein